MAIISIRTVVTFCVIASLSVLLASPRIVANPDGDRVLSIYNIHNKETLSIVYKRNGKLIPEAVEKLNWIMRDWRRDLPTEMDPKLFDILWEIHTELGSREPIHLISGYRSPKTNEMLRKTRGGQARKSQHLLGKATDVHFPDVPTRNLRYSALVREQGGVGYYPTSALPFVHIDTGRVRHWPQMGRTELALLFPDGHTKHRPSSGGAVSRADYERARSRDPSLATKVASYQQLRGGSHQGAGIMVASLGATPTPSGGNASGGNASGTGRMNIPVPVLASADAAFISAASGPSNTATSPPAKTRVARTRVASASLAPVIEAPLPILTSLGRLAQRSGLTSVRQVASANAALNSGEPTGINGLLARDRNSSTATTVTVARQIDSTELPGPTNTGIPGTRTLAVAYLEMTGWASAPAYDPEHPGELHYRPFPIGPLLSANPSIDDPAMAALVHPDQNGARDLIDTDEAVPQRFRPGLQYAEMMWSDLFTGGSSENILAAGFESEPSDLRRIRTANTN